MKVYVAAPYTDAPQVLVIHRRLRAAAIEPTSTWAESAAAPEDLRALDPGDVRAAIETNKRDLLASHIVFALPQEGAGGEMFCEVARALEWGIPVVWSAAARVVLSAYNEGVLRVDGPLEGLAFLRGFARIVRWSRGIDGEHVRDTLWSIILYYEYERSIGRIRPRGRSTTSGMGRS